MQTFNKGDKVYLITDPDKSEGVVVEIMFERIFVCWRRAGRTWVYAANQLAHVEVAVAA